MCKNLYEYNTQYRKIIGEYLFPKGSTYILGQKYWGSTFKLGNKYWGSTFSQGVLLGCYNGTHYDKQDPSCKIGTYSINMDPFLKPGTHFENQDPF